MTGHRIIKNLTKRGNSVLGVGVYSAALAANNGIDAIKVGTNLDDPWLDFKALVIEPSANNIHLPQLKSFYYDSNSEFFVCVMEKLESIPYCQKITKVIDACKEYIEGYLDTKEMYSILSNNTKLVPEPQQLIAVLDNIKKYTTHLENSKPIHVSDTEFNDEDFEQDYDGRKLDMHRDNFMLRDEVLVITDPWCNVYMDDVPDLSIWLEDEIQW